MKLAAKNNRFKVPEEWSEKEIKSALRRETTIKYGIVTLGVASAVGLNMGLLAINPLLLILTVPPTLLISEVSGLLIKNTKRQTKIDALKSALREQRQ